jgi:uncharacterized protein YhfF
MSQSSQVEAFWQTYLHSVSEQERARANAYDIWYFGDTEEVAEHCAELVCAGIKTATSGLVWEMEADGEKLPEPGDLVVVTGLRGEPRCVVEVTECVVKPFDEIDAQFAIDYGEGDRTLEGWRRDSWQYFAPICDELGREPSETMPLACQRFRLLYPRAGLGTG